MLLAGLTIWGSACANAEPPVVSEVVRSAEVRLVEGGADEGQLGKEAAGVVATAPGNAYAALAPSGSASAPQPFWPRFHGPNFDNISPDKGLLKQWPEGGPPLRWKRTGIGEGFSSVTLADGRIFTAGNIGGKTVVTALDLEGRVLWQAENGPAWTGSYPGTRGTPTIDGSRVYHESPLGQLSCYDAATGKVLWSVNILERFRSRNITWALAESVLIDGDRVICCPGGPEVSVVALNKLSGKTVWAAPSTGDLAGYASPSLGTFARRRIIFTMNARAIIGVDADRGELLFRHEHITDYDVNALMPIYRDGFVFVSTGYGTGAKLLRLVPAGRKIDVELIWAERRFDNHHGGVILLDGYLYGSNHQGRWMCLNFATGEIVYQHPGVGKGSLTYADGMFYVLSERGVVGLVEATPKAHRVVSQFRLPPDGSGPSWAHPVVIGGTLYIRHGDVLYAYDVRGG
ncbi:MAG: PQQ-like beta-propeller repeat protein [Thermoguttaceae bacterium]|nr:PQQ-like beta-propeller repeat protein [Thermoguttaceae bacterium]MDW8078770.1 PQQ-binding-like beta-propeller repeat protein [Thermoguttaceae bacterium]